MQVSEIMTTDVLTVQQTDALETAAAAMYAAGIHHMPVLDGERLVGILSERDILRLKAAKPNGGKPPTVAQAMQGGVETTRAGDDLAGAAARMAALRIGSLPVLDDGGTRLVGMLTATDILAMHGDAAFSRRRYTVADAMTRSPESVSPEDTLTEGIARLLENNVRHLPVVDSANRVVGMLSDRDIRENIGDPIEFAREGNADVLDTMTVSDAMNDSPTTTTADAPLAEVVRYFIDEKIGAIPVVDSDDHLVGIISYVDVLDPVPAL